MYQHAPPGYDCPFCRIISSDFGPILSRPEDVVLRAAGATAFVNIAWWPRNPGAVIVIPNAHFENLYDLPDDAALAVHQAARTVALAMKRAYGCDGTSTRQHNEPAGNQEVWHYHLHVFPRYHGDELYTSHRRLTTPEERAPHAARLRELL
jgi:histidine triad (HIT) family protein